MANLQKKLNKVAVQRLTAGTETPERAAAAQQQFFAALNAMSEAKRAKTMATLSSDKFKTGWTKAQSTARKTLAKRAAQESNLRNARRGLKEMGLNGTTGTGKAAPGAFDTPKPASPGWKPTKVAWDSKPRRGAPAPAPRKKPVNTMSADRAEDWTGVTTAKVGKGRNIAGNTGTRGRI